MRRPPDIEVLFQPCFAAADKAKGVVGVSCVGCVDGGPFGDVGLGPRGCPDCACGVGGGDGDWVAVVRVVGVLGMDFAYGLALVCMIVGWRMSTML